MIVSLDVSRGKKAGVTARASPSGHSRESRVRPAADRFSFLGSQSPRVVFIREAPGAVELVGLIHQHRALLAEYWAGWSAFPGIGSVRSNGRERRY